MLKYVYTITYEATIDDNGNVIETKILDKKEKKEHQDESSEPLLILEDNKFKLTSAAIALMGVNVGDKLDINYDGNVPVIGTNTIFGTGGGTKLTKLFTCSFRGNKNVELRKRGTEFKVIAHPNTKGVFILDSGKAPEPELAGDENIQMPEEDDFDLDSLINVDESDAQITEIKSSFFTFK